ncbi:MAG: hypothetical protein ACR9NN_23320 [Nostochopsis sp.]
MKNTWISPELTIYGSVENLTQAKTIGLDDGYSATITGPDGQVIGTVPVGGSTQIGGGLGSI